MRAIEQLEEIAYTNNLTITDNFLFNSELKGLIIENNIFLSKDLENDVEKKCILAEELAHKKFNSGNITDLRSIRNRREERKARRYSNQLLIQFDQLVRAIIHFKNDATFYNVAGYLEVTEEFLKETIITYSKIYGPFKEFGEYLITFSPFRVVEKAKYFNQ